MRATVEVDELEIVNGPGATKFLQVALLLMDSHRCERRGPDFRARVVFTVKSAASTETTPATVYIESMSQNASGAPTHFYFAGRYQGNAVEGLYSLRNKTGSMNQL